MTRPSRRLNRAVEAGFMRRALALARRGRGKVSPNPMVGCVLVKNGRIVAEGWHKAYGGPHAEAEALRRAGPRARGSTAYVALEPCTEHPGKLTASCAQALIRAGVSEVAAALKDPNPGVSGRGLDALSRAGVKTRVGLLASEARALNQEFLSRMRARRPYVILKAALSLDGRAYAPGGLSRWVTGPDSRAEARGLRARSDAVLVGVGTVIADDPRLTCRGAGRDPLRVVLDTRLRIPPRSRLLSGGPPTLVFTASARGIAGAETIRVPTSRRGLSLAAVLSELLRRGVRRLLVEGGPTVHASFLRANAVDEAWVFIAPKLLSGSSDPNRAPKVLSPRLRRLGQDFLFYGRVACSRG